MRLSSEELRSLYQQETGRPARGRAECLAADVLLRAAAGESGQAEREEVARHLIACADCAQEYRLVREFKPWADRVAAAGGPEPSAVKETAAPRPRRWPRLRATLWPQGAPYALAAALLVVSLALGGWVTSLRRENNRLKASPDPAPVTAEASRQEALREESARRAQQLAEATRRAEQGEAQIAELRRTVDELSRPQPNVPITDLEPRDSARAGGGAATAVEVEPAAPFFTLILHVDGEPSHASFTLEVVDARGQRLWRVPGLRKSRLNTFTVALPRRQLPAGEYRLKLYGLRAGRREPVAEYQMRVN